MNVTPRLALAAVIGLVGSVQLASAIVITSNDFNAFAAAVENAPDGTVVTFNLGANSTIFFDRRLTIQHDVTFDGGGSVIFDGQSSTGLFQLQHLATFENLTFQNGHTASPFGGSAGAINSAFKVTIDHCAFLNNFAENTGGAISGFCDVSDSLFAFNHAGNSGGAISVSGQIAPNVIQNSTFFGNTAGNTAGAINAGAGQLGTTILRNVTVFGNQANNVGPGVVDTNGGSLVVESSLIAGNTTPPGHPAADLSYGQFMDSNTLAVNNSLIGSSLDNGLTNGVNGNLIGDGTFVNGFPIANLLAALADNGGLTQTMALLDFNAMTNPAINAGSNSQGFLYDQRGPGFARSSGGGVDIGAFERQVPEPSTLALAAAGMALISLARLRRRSS